MMAVFFFITHEKGFKFHAQPQTGAYSCLIWIQCSMYIIYIREKNTISGEGLTRA